MPLDLAKDARAAQREFVRDDVDVFAIGEVLEGKYEIRSVLGSGGMGQAFEAHDIPLNRRVAIKAPWSSIDPASIKKEAQALAAIRHTSMVAVHAIGQHRGVDYVVMERIYGVSLDAHLRRRRSAGERYGLGEGLQVLSALAEGLAAVHRAGIAHRDVKPENIMLTPGHRLVLMDFGIFVPEFELQEQSLPAGSPAYMAPETISGTLAPGAGHLVDTYALGVIAYEILSGDLPYNGATVVEVLDGHMRGAVPDVGAARPDVPKRLSTLIARLMSKEPSDRPESMDDVAYELRAIHDGLLRAQLSVIDMRAAAPSPAEPSSSASQVLRSAAAPVAVEEVAAPSAHADTGDRPTIEVSLQASPPAASVPTAPPTRDADRPTIDVPPATKKPFRVMIVDDDVDISRLLSHFTKKAVPDADIKVANDAEKALTMLASHPPDVLLLDLHMPRVNGIEVCMYVRGMEATERCTIISVSAGAQQEDVQLLQQLGVTRFIPKDAELSKNVQAMLKSLRAGR
jgi:serine/threonine protein kinase